jgi:hypothetical protein
MLQVTHYSIDAIRDEVRHLTDAKVIDRHQPIYTLCRYFPSREWVCIECELEDHDYLLRDRIGDLLGREDWSDD